MKFLNQLLISNRKKTPVIINPKVVPANNTIVNPKQLIQLIKNQPDVAFVTPQLTVGVFYNNAKTQISGRAIGILPEEANQMFNMESYVVEGSVNNLKNNINGILLGAGVASINECKTRRQYQYYFIYWYDKSDESNWCFSNK
jgi:lipoprotein-releasing system permease protein